jgi:hypothetical protein
MQARAFYVALRDKIREMWNQTGKSGITPLPNDFAVRKSIENAMPSFKLSDAGPL